MILSTTLYEVLPDGAFYISPIAALIFPWLPAFLAEIGLEEMRLSALYGAWYD